VNDLTIDLFAGPGGWDVAARSLGLRNVAGLEIDAAACQTRTAAGHVTIRADVSAYPVSHLAGLVKGMTGSPPCTTFSAAGKGSGNAVMDILAASIPEAFAGRATRAATRRAMARELQQQRLTAPGYAKLTRAKRSAAIWRDVRNASLVVEPARFIHTCRPEWVALEQVPAVLPLWRAYAAELRALGYSVWCGKLNAADYGVPQTRERAILIASRVRRVRRPEPTHYDPRKGGQLWGEPWVSMAEALGWGADGRPGPAVTAGGTATGGAEPFGHRDRDMLAAERDAGRWVLHTNRDQRPDGGRQTADPRSAPAPALTAKSGGQWVLRKDAQANAAERPAPAPTISFGHAAGEMRWVFRNNNNNNNNACTRSLDEPAGTLFFSQRSNWAAWVQQRPATTVQGDPRVGRPGHKNRDKGEAQFAQDSVRITVEEAATLQSFPADYPWRGTKTKRFEQVGNAVPPLLAAHVLAMATGLSVRSASDAAA